MANAKFHQARLKTAIATGNKVGVAYHTAELAKLSGKTPAPSPAQKAASPKEPAPKPDSRVAELHSSIKEAKQRGDLSAAAAHGRRLDKVVAEEKAEPEPDKFAHARAQIAKARAEESGSSEPAEAQRKPKVRTPTLFDQLSDDHKVERLRIDTEARRSAANEKTRAAEVRRQGVETREAASARRVNASAERAESAAAAAKVRHEATISAAESAAKRREAAGQNKVSQETARLARNKDSADRAAQRAHEQHVRHQTERLHQVTESVARLGENTQRIQHLVNQHVH